MRQTTPPRKNRTPVRALAALAALLISACSLEPPAKIIPVREVSVEAGGMRLDVRSNDGAIRATVHQPGLELFPDDGDSLVLERLILEIEDGLSGRVFDTRDGNSAVTSFEQTPEGLLLGQRFPGSPFSLRQNLRGERDGVFIDAWIASREDTVRSVTVTWVLPLPRGFNFWIASGGEPLALEDGLFGEYACGPAGEGTERTAIPLAALWRADGPGFSVAVPLDIPTVRVTYSIELESLPPGLASVSGDNDRLRVRFDLIGLRPGRELRTGLWLYAHEADWRPSLAAFADKYRDFFEPRAGALRRDGFISLVDPPDSRGIGYNPLRQQDVSIANIAWNWRRPGEWLMPQVLRFDDFTWDCEAVSGRWNQVSAEQVRAAIENATLADLRSVLQGAFSQFCHPETAHDRFREDIARNDAGETMTDRRGHVLMRSTPDSPFGRYMLEQQKAMMELFPQAGGFYFDNWKVASLDFAHDDSLATVDNRPAWDIGRNLAGTGRALIESARDARKLVLADAPAVVSLSRGIDVLTVDPAHPEAIPEAAYLGLLRPVLARQRPGGPLHGPEGIEETLQQQLLWGVLPSHEQLERDQVVGRAYRPLFQALRGRQWVLDPGALSVSGAAAAQVFRIPAADRGVERDLLVSVVRPGVRLADQSQRRGVVVRVRTPEARTVTRALWQPAGLAWSLPVRPTVEGEETLVLELPPFGPAGVLRLSQR